MFVVGPKVKAGLHGTHPDLAALDNGDLKFTTDFRTVYAGLLKDWLNSDPVDVLRGEFAPMPLIA